MRQNFLANDPLVGDAATVAKGCAQLRLFGLLVFVCVSVRGKAVTLLWRLYFGSRFFNAAEPNRVSCYGRFILTSRDAAEKQDLVGILRTPILVVGNMTEGG